MGHLTVLTGCMFSGKTTELLRRVAMARAESGRSAAAIGLKGARVLVFKHAVDDRYRRDAVVTHGGETVDAEVVCGAEEIVAAVFAVGTSEGNPPQSRVGKEGGEVPPQSPLGKGGGTGAPSSLLRGWGTDDPGMPNGPKPAPLLSPVSSSLVSRPGAPSSLLRGWGTENRRSCDCDSARSLLPGESGTRLVAIDEAHFFGVELCDVVKRIRAAGIDVLVTALDRGSWGQRFQIVDRLIEVADEHVELFALCARCGARADRTQRLTPIVDGRLVGGPEAYEPRCATCWHAPSEPRPGDAVKSSSRRP